MGNKRSDRAADGSVGVRGSGEKLRVLFLCNGEACRAQMAAGWARHLCGDRVEVWSAGSIPNGLHPLAVRVMAEAGVDISTSEPHGVNEYVDMPFDWVVTLCEQAVERCPPFRGEARFAHLDISAPPSTRPGDENEGQTMQDYRHVRDQIRLYVEQMPGVLEETEIPAMA